MNTLFCVTLRELEYLYKQHWASLFAPDPSGPWLAGTAHMNKEIRGHIHKPG